MIQKMLPESLLHFWEQQEDMVMMLASTQEMGIKITKKVLKKAAQTDTRIKFISMCCSNKCHSKVQLKRSSQRMSC
jgi:hypothetical protein